MRLHVALAGLLLIAPACVTQLMRYDEPARVTTVALGSNADEPDLILVDLTWSCMPKDRRNFVIVVPREPDAQLSLDDGWEYAKLSPREKTILKHKTEHWSADKRLREDVAGPADVPESERRDYSVRNVIDPSQHFDLEVTRTRNGTSERVGSLRLPDELTPTQMAPAVRTSAAVSLAVIDVASLPLFVASAALAIALAPLGHWEQVRDAFDPDLRGYFRPVE